MKLGTRYILYIVILLFGIVTIWGGSQRESLQTVCVGMLTLLGGVLLGIFWLRCPKCGRPLARGAIGKNAYCTHCGAKIDWSAK